MGGQEYHVGRGATATSDIFVITGLPRSGTTYAAAVLHRPPDVVTRSEAGGSWKDLYRRDGRDADVCGAMRAMRDRIAAGEPVGTFEGTAGFAGEGRVDTWNQKKVERALQTADDFVLGVKNPEVFLAWLPTLVDAGVRCVVTVRHPLGIIASWIKRGRKRVERGKSLDGTFANGESVTYASTATDPVARRIDLHNHLVGQILVVRDHPSVLLVRYEDWFTDPTQLARIAEFVGIECPPELRPAPIPPDPPDHVDADEQAAIVRGCAVAAELGYECGAVT